MMKLILIAALLGGFLLAATPTQAQAAHVFCGPATAMFETLRDKYGEVPRFRGKVRETTVILMIGDDSWTFVAINPDGIACMTASGTDPVFIPDPIKGTDA